MRVAGLSMSLAPHFAKGSYVYGKGFFPTPYTLASTFASCGLQTAEVKRQPHVRELVVSSVRSGSVILGNAAGVLGSAGGEGPSATRDWLSAVLRIQC